MKFYGHLVCMNNNRITDRIFEHFNNNVKTSNNWFKNVRKDMAEKKIIKALMIDRNKIKNVKFFKGFQKKEKEKTSRMWTEEQKKLHSKRMREYWKN